MEPDPEVPQEGHVLFHGVGGDPEPRQQPAHDPAGLLLAVEHVHLEPLPGEERRGCEARGPRPDDGNPRAPGACLAPREHAAHHELSVALLGRDALGIADAHRPFPVEARAVQRALVVAEVACHEGKRVPAVDDVEGLLELALAHQVHVLGHVLRDGAGLDAGRHEAVEQGQRSLDGDFLRAPELLAVAGSREREPRGGCDAFGVDPPVLRPRGNPGGDLGELLEPAVASRLQQVRGEGDRPDPAGKDLRDVPGGHAARERQGKPALERFRETGGEGDGERVQRPARHVHLGARQHRLRVGGGERVGELGAEELPPPLREGQEPREHGHGVGPLQVLREARLPSARRSRSPSLSRISRTRSKPSRVGLSFTSVSSFFSVSMYAQIASISPGGQPCMVESVTEEQIRGEMRAARPSSAAFLPSHGVPARRPGSAASSAVSRA